MATELEKSMMLPAPALTVREYELFDRTHRIGIWLTKFSRTETINRVKDEWDLTQAQAEAWVAKAEDAMAVSAVEDIDEARRRYRFRLEQILNHALGAVREDQEEITVKPMAIEVIMQGERSTRQTINGTVVKRRVKVFNHNALAIAVKVTERLARLDGIRTGEGKLSIGAAQINNYAPGSGLPTAQSLDLLDNEQLAKVIGMNVVSNQEAASVPVLPNHAGREGAAAPVPNGIAGGHPVDAPPGPGGGHEHP